MHLNLAEQINDSKNLLNWFLQERDKLLRYRKQRKKMAKIPKVKEYMKYIFLKTRLTEKNLFLQR